MMVLGLRRKMVVGVCVMLVCGYVIAQEASLAPEDTPLEVVESVEQSVAVVAPEGDQAPKEAVAEAPIEPDASVLTQEPEVVASEQVSTFPVDELAPKVLTGTVPEEVQAEFISETAQPEVVAVPGEDEVEDEELAGIDTVDLDAPQGNWLFKRLWWERAEEKYEEIRALEAQILELRLPFFMKRSDVDRTILDPFYLHIANDRGALEILMGDIADFLAQEAQEGMLDENERAIRDQLQAERETLEQLQKSIQAILTYDHELDAAIGTLMEQLTRVNEYEQEAWAHFKEIGRVLDDKKAREYVLKMKNIYRNIKEIEDYIKERFTIYFDQLVATIKENAEKITATMDQLTEKGIDLKEQLGQAKEEAKFEREEEQEEVRKPKVEERGFFDRWIISPMSSFFGAIWDGIVAVVSWPFKMLFGSEKPVAIRIDQQDELVVLEPEEQF